VRRALAQVEKRLAQDRLVAQHERDEKTPDAAVAVEKWVDRLELDRRESGLEQRWYIHRLAVKESFEGRHQLLDAIGRRRHEERISRPAAADPVLGSPE
jgi:hypothetical protein